MSFSISKISNVSNVSKNLNISKKEKEYKKRQKNMNNMSVNHYINYINATPKLEILNYIYSLNIPQYITIDQLSKAYSLPVVQNNPETRKVKVAIVIAYTYPNLLNDFSTYWQSPIIKGINSNPPDVSVHTMSGALYSKHWAEESCLDLQILASINPNAEIYVVEARSSFIADMVKAVNYATDTLKVDIVSMSWGVDDHNTLSRYSSAFNRPNVCFCASSGDTNVASWPSVLSQCLSVGGTTLNIFGDKKQETNWNSAGCGYATFVSKPQFQSEIASDINKRLIPDVSGIANPITSVYTFFENNWSGLGGTSVSAPLWAGILSLAIQLRLNNNKTPFATGNMSLQNYLYKTILPNEEKYKSCFNDIVYGGTYGSSTISNSKLSFFTTTSGFDIPTGLGSPNITNLCNELLSL